jgi:hypothetical protein
VTGVTWRRLLTLEDISLRACDRRDAFDCFGAAEADLAVKDSARGFDGGGAALKEEGREEMEKEGGGGGGGGGGGMVVVLGCM